MRELNDEEILAIWSNATDFTDPWDEVISEYLYKIEEMKNTVEPYQQVTVENLEAEIQRLSREIEDTVERARSGELSAEDLETTFRSIGEQLLEIETRLLELEFEEEEGYTSWGDEDEEEY